MNEPMHTYILRRLKETRRQWPVVSVGSGVPISTLRKIAQRHIANPGVEHCQKLYDYFKRTEQSVGARAA